MKDSVHIVPFKAEHLQQLQPREFEGRELAALSIEEAEFRVKEYLRRGAAWALVKGGQVIACAGIFRHWRGVAEVWAVTTALVPCYPLAFHRAIRDGLRREIRVMNLHRVQTAVREDHVTSLKWLKRLGFNYEGAMRGYGPNGETYQRLAWVRRESQCRS